MDWCCVVVWVVAKLVLWDSQAIKSYWQRTIIMCSSCNVHDEYFCSIFYSVLQEGEVVCQKQHKLGTWCAMKKRFFVHRTYRSELIHLFLNCLSFVSFFVDPAVIHWSVCLSFVIQCTHSTWKLGVCSEYFLCSLAHVVL